MADKTDPQYWLDLARNAEAAGDQAAVDTFVAKAREVFAAAKTGPKVVQEFEDGGRIVERGGVETYLGAGGSIATSDPGTIARIRAGESLGDISRRSYAEDIISQVGELPARAASALKGIPFYRGWADEVIGKMFGEDAMTATRAAQEAREIVAPKTATASRVGTGVAAAIPMIGAQVAMLPATLGGRVLGGAALGGLEGALEGYVGGYGEGKTPQERQAEAQRQAVLGGAVGGGLGAAGPLVGAAIGAGGKSIIQRPAQKVGREIGAQDAALEILSEAAEVDALTAAQNLQRAGQYASMGQMGPTTRGLLDFVAQSPVGGSVARQNIEEVAGLAGRQFDELLDTTLGGPRAVQELQDLLMETTSGTRREAYDAAYDATIDFGRKEADELLERLERIDPAILAKAERIARYEGKPSLNKMVKIDEAGNIIGWQDLPDVRFIDYVTRALNDVEGVGAVEMKNAQRSLASEIRGLADQLVPEYANARDIAASVIDLRNALDIGNDLLKPKMKVYDVQKAVKTMKSSELNAVRQGLRSHLDEIMGNVKTAMTDPNVDAREVVKGLKELSSRNAKDKVRLILGEDQAKEFFRQFDEVYSAMSMRAGIARGSATQPRQMVGERVEAEAAKLQSGLGLLQEGGSIPQIVARALPQADVSKPQIMQEITRQLAVPLTRQRDLTQLLAQQQALRAAAPQLQRGREFLERSMLQGTNVGKALTLGAAPSLLYDR